MDNDQIAIINTVDNEINLYEQFLYSRNLSKQTIHHYSVYAKRFLLFCEYQNKAINKESFIKFIQCNQDLLKATSLRSKYICTTQFLKFKNLNFINEMKANFKLPAIYQTPKFIISQNELKLILNSFDLKKFYQFKKYMWLKILFETGIRAFEFQKLKKKDIENTFIRIVGKGKKERLVFITPELKQLMKYDWPFEYFCTDKNGRIVTIKHLRKLLKKIGQQFGYSESKSITPHMLRRSFCTNLIKRGCNLKIVQNLMGHNSISTTAKYLFFNEVEMYEEYLKCI